MNIKTVFLEISPSKSFQLFLTNLSLGFIAMGKEEA